ncbi:hypothetical protein J437_LFUL004089 [Ladona fulva]|uniref:Cadherin domain-containing protein n=1 Tax=Ladona fulva TaxID=123851 RepID=A0A8K0NZ61_LADFU|nr:hypothetical protein J437_LFUL004089 [Ladona fulva]
MHSYDELLKKIYGVVFLYAIAYPKIRINVLDKNDSPPSFRDTPIEYTVSEDLSAGQAVATLRATDPDTLGTLTYTLVSTEGGDESRFELDANTGVLRLKQALDREERDTYRLVVRASDGIQNTDADVTIKKLNEN